MYLDVVRDSAKSLGLLDPDGRLAPMDSLAILDLVTKLEEAARLTIPTNAVTPDRFESVESVAELLVSVAGNR